MMAAVGRKENLPRYLGGGGGARVSFINLNNSFSFCCHLASSFVIALNPNTNQDGLENSNKQAIARLGKHFYLSELNFNFGLYKPDEICLSCGRFGDHKHLALEANKRVRMFGENISSFCFKR